nr:MAG TPA: hypothetical protein [Caudoviricetes sp.]
MGCNTRLWAKETINAEEREEYRIVITSHLGYLAGAETPHFPEEIESNVDRGKFGIC